MRKNSLIILALFFFSLLAVWPLLHKGFFLFHDDAQVARVFEMKQALLAGEFPVRWVPDLGYGYGYPIFNFYAPLAYYIGAFFALLGFATLPATKLMIGIGMLLAVFGMYLFARQFLSKTAAFVSALLYMYAPYHAVNLYVRGAIAELWAYALVPFAFYGFYKVFVSLIENKGRKTKNKGYMWIAVAAVSYAGIVLSHNLTALMVTPFLLIFMFILGFRLYRQKNISSLIPLLTALILGILLSAFYWLPALTEMKYTNVVSVTGGGSQYKDHFVCLSQLWNSQWGYGGSAPGCLDGLSFQLGKLHILLGGLSLVAFVLTKKRRHWIYLFALGGFLVSVIMLLPVSKPLWDGLSFMKYIQFPWRYLGLAAFFLSFLGGYSIWVLQDYTPRKLKEAVVSAVIVFVVGAGIVVLYGKYFKPQMTISNYRDETNLLTLRWTISKISDEYLPPNFVKPTSEKDVVTERVVDPLHHTLYSSPTLTSLHIVPETDQKRQLQVNLAAFPAWHFSYKGSDDKQHPFTPQVQHGIYFISLPLPPSQTGYEATISYQQTPVEKLADALTVIGLLGLILGIILRFLPKTNAKAS